MSTTAETAVVEIVTLTVAAFEPGVTEFGDKLQVVLAGAPLHASFTALPNDPPTGVTANVYVALAPA